MGFLRRRKPTSGSLTTQPAAPALPTYSFGIVTVPGASVTVEGWNRGPQTTNSDGYLYVLYEQAPITHGAIMVAADGYDPVVLHDVDFASWGGKNMPVPLQAQHFDPTSVPLAQLRRIRGAMWPNANGELVLPMGPRPDTSHNIIAPEYLDRYPQGLWDPINAVLTRRGYWNVDTGPTVDDPSGYHGQYPNPNVWHWSDPPDVTQAQWDRHLDVLQWWWDHGKAPIEFLHQDGWNFEQTRNFFTPLLQQPRAQKLIRVLVPSGWEPAKYEWSNATWCRYFTWARALMPDALLLVHLYTDTDAPVGTDALEPVAVPNGEAWRRIYDAGCRGWLIQNGPYGTSPQADPTLAQNFAAQFQTTGYAADVRSIAWHFRGNAGWPVLIGHADPEEDLLLVNGECTAYTGYWSNLDERAREGWGDLSQQAGAAGYFDGGTVTVGGAVPPPWVR